MEAVLRRLFFASFLLLGFAGSAGADGTYRVLGELAPTTTLPYEEKAGLTRAVMREVPLAELASLFELEGGFDWSYRSGGYQGEIAPNVVASIGAGDEARVRAFALAWSYVYRQDAVPFFADAARGRQAMRLRFERGLTREAEASLYAALVEALGDEAGYTRVSEGEIVVIDFRGDPAFASAAERLAAEVFNVQGELCAHDWRADPSGEALLAGMSLAPEMEAKVRALRARYEHAVSALLDSRRVVAAIPQHRDHAQAMEPRAGH